jgi:hypothetical protein
MNLNPVYWWTEHGTKILGTVGAVIPGLLGIQDLIPQPHTKYWLAAGVVIGALTVRRGFVNTQQAQE